MSEQGTERLTGEFAPRPAGTPDEERERRNELDAFLAEAAARAAATEQVDGGNDR